MKKIKIFLCLLTSILVPPRLFSQQLTTQQKARNLYAFSRIFGYVRYFYPSRSSASIDWNKFASYGSDFVITAGNDEILKSKLEELFKPIAPRIKLTDKKEMSSKNDSACVCKPTEYFTWQHYGGGIHDYGRVFASKITNNKSNNNLAMNGIFTHLDDGDKLLNKSLTLKIRSRASDSLSNKSLFIHFYSLFGKELAKSNFVSAATSGEWTEFIVTTKVNEVPAFLLIETDLTNHTKIYLDTFQLILSEPNKSITLKINNEDFEAADSGGKPSNWEVISNGSRLSLTNQYKFSGNYSICIANDNKMLLDALFSKNATLNESIDEEILPKLFFHAPLAICKDTALTLTGHRRFAKLTTDLAKYQPSKQALYLGDITITWNAIEHFYPYFDDDKVNWKSILIPTLQNTISLKNDLQFHFEINKMVANINDGHAAVYSRAGYEQYGFSFQTDFIENQFVVTAVDSSINCPLKNGDVILAIDGMKAVDRINILKKFVSGSPQWKLYNACLLFGYGEKGEIAKIDYSRDGVISSVRISRNDHFAANSPMFNANIKFLRDSVLYVNLCTADMNYLNLHLVELQRAKKIVFDLRGRPKNNTDILRYLLNAPDTASHWMNIPQIIYPDHRETAGYSSSGWQLQPFKEKIKAKVAFLTDVSAISYSESFLNIVSHYKLGAIISETPTAGANGNICEIDLPGNYQLYWTGMKVTNPDGSLFHNIGVKPDIQAKRTITGVKKNQDEILERAIRYLEEGE